MSRDRVLCEIIKARENIKRKYSELKHGEADFQSEVEKTLKPVIEPLNKIQRQTLNHPAEEKGELQNDNKEEIDQKGNFELLLLENWFSSPDLDKKYGPKKIHNQITLGKNEIKFTNEKILIVIDSETVEYKITVGLLKLIFLKSPTLYTEHDLDTYKTILLQTSAHLTSDGTKVKIGGKKYNNIISKLFTAGRGLCMKLQKSNLVYWDDANELVHRLRLLISSKLAGNTGVSNEILSIFEELLEAGLIKRIPNV